MDILANFQFICKTQWRKRLENSLMTKENNLSEEWVWLYPNHLLRLPMQMWEEALWPVIDLSYLKIIIFVKFKKIVYSIDPFYTINYFVSKLINQI